MKLSDAKKYLPFVQAAAAGKTIQWLAEPGEWLDFCPEDTIETIRELRIKPEPKLRPWTPEEVPVGALLKTDCYAAVILGVTFNGEVQYAGGIGNIASKKTEFIMNWNHSLDGGKTWLPCGVEVSE